jgi:hypothetical protein
MPGWVNSIQKISDDAGGYVDWDNRLTTRPSTPIIPTIASVSTSEINIDALTTAQIVGARITLNAPDTLTAATRLAASGTDTYLMSVGETIGILSNESITNVYVAFLANIAVVEAAYSAPTATPTIYNNTAVADYLTIQVQFDFESTDNVRYIDAPLIGISDGTTDKNLGIFKLMGSSL